MKLTRLVVHVCFALSLAACSGGLSVVPIPGEATPNQTLSLEFSSTEAGVHPLPFRISGGVPPYESRLDGCPDWVTLFRDQGILAGTAPAADWGRTFFCTYVVTDSAFPDPQSVTFGLRLVVRPAESLALPSTFAQAFVIGTFRSVILPAATGGVGPYTYTFTCAGGMLPSGVGFSPATRVLAGTADAVFHDSCTYTVADSSQPAATVSRGVEVTSAAAGPLVLAPVPDQAFVIGTFRSVILPAATGGVGPYMYTFTCAGGMLPTGVGFSPATRVLAGTADAVFHDSCTYTVADSSQPAATVSRGVEVTSAAAGPLVLAPVPDQAFVIGTFRSVILPAATGGVGPYTYTFTCAGGMLPSGVGFSPATRVLAGTADAVFHDSCTYTVADSSQPAATVSRGVEVTSAAAGPLVLAPVPDQAFVIGTFRSVILPAATGGVGPYTYTFTCAGGMLPSGVGFSPATRVLAGTADAVFHDSCTYTVADSSQPAATVSRGVEVTSAAAGPLVLAPVPDQAFVIGTFRSVILPAATGGVGPYMYTFTCAGGMLPTGVGFSPATRVLAGTADAVFHDSCTYTVADSSQPAATVSRGVEVTSAAAGPLVLAPVPDQAFVIGTFRSVILPAATGGVGPYTYTFTCAGGMLPSGVGFSPATRVLAGTADAVFHDSCTYTVADSSQPAATVSRSVEVMSAAAGPLVLRDLDKLDLSVGTFHSGALPVATGGVEPYTYSFTCAGGALPSGMGFAPETRVFAGTPDASFRDSCTYTVTDNALTSDTVSVAVEVQVTGGATVLELTQVFADKTDNELTLSIGRRSRTTFQEASGGVAPYTYELADCTLPAGIEFHPSTRVLSGTPDAEYRGPNCTYRVTDSAVPTVSVSLPFELTVEPLEEDAWRFRTRTVEPDGPCAEHSAADGTPLNADDRAPLMVATMPAAHGGAGDAMYALPGVSEQAAADTNPNLLFDPSNRVLTYTNPNPPPVLGTPNTYRYLVGTETTGVDAENAEDALCLDVQYVRSNSDCEVRTPFTHIKVILQVRDDAFWDENADEYRCPDTTAPPPRSGMQGSPSNPVHEALGPVHARRASAVAHAAVRDRVLGWSPGEEQASFAIAPEVGLASLSGRSEGFDYSGTSESASFGAETGVGAWQAGLVASFTRTELHYRAEASLAEHGYVAGEHHTEVLSVHPFAAWHAPSGGHVRASMGAGTGELRHRDDHGFPSWSRSDVHLRSWTVGASVPVADILTGELQAEAGIESFSFDIEGGGRISSSLPTLRGRDWRAGLAWSAPVPGAPSVSVAYRRLTGDGPEGGRLDARGSVSVEGIFDPRLALLANAEGSFGLGDLDHDFWGLSGGVHFAPDASRRGFGMDLDVRLMSLDDERPAGVGVRGEAGYGLWSASLLGRVRPYVGLIRHPGDAFVRRTVGLHLRDTPATQVRVEVQDHNRAPSAALELTVHHRF